MSDLHCPHRDLLSAASVLRRADEVLIRSGKAKREETKTLKHKYNAIKEARMWWHLFSGSSGERKAKESES